MEVKKIWRAQYIICWSLLFVLLVGAGFLMATDNFGGGCVLIIVGVVLETISTFLMMRNYRCPKCGAVLNKRILNGGSRTPGLVICPHCKATL
ncbi:MAG: hypothetical protein RR403_07380, partial [Pseudoflavonifractor sp.]